LIETMAAVEEEQEDLYGDLDNNEIPILPAAKRIKSSASISSLEKKLEKLQKRLLEVTKENEALKRNMGTLYRTAQSELRRKDNEILSLQQQLDEKNGLTT